MTEASPGISYAEWYPDAIYDELGVNLTYYPGRAGAPSAAPARALLSCCRARSAWGKRPWLGKG
jgi:hypothetical protein